MTNQSNNINEFVNLVNLKVRLSDFISQFINLSEKGNSYVGKCPFHNENTPSFNVNNEKGLFYCFMMSASCTHVSSLGHILEIRERWDHK